MAVFKLIVRRICIGLAEKFLYRLRYFVGLIIFMAFLWLLKIALPWLIDTQYWDSLQSKQIEDFEEQTQIFRSTKTDSGK
jgi:hypothetical protein